MSLRNQKIVQQFANSTANRFFQWGTGGAPTNAAQFIAVDGQMRFPTSLDQVETWFKPANLSLGPAGSGSIVPGISLRKNNSTYHITAWVSGVQSDGSAGFSGLCCATIKKVGAGAPALVGASTTLFLQEDLASAPTISIAPSGTDLTVNWDSGAVLCEVTCAVLVLRVAID